MLAMLVQCGFAVFGMNMAAQVSVPSEIHAHDASGSPEETQTESDSQQIPAHKDELELLSRASGAQRFSPAAGAFQAFRQFAIQPTSVSPPRHPRVFSASPANGFSPTSPSTFRNLPLLI